MLNRSTEGQRPNIPISENWLRQAGELREQFDAAAPFPLLVLDDFLDAELAHTLLAEFPEISSMPRSRDYVFGKKHELSSIESVGPGSARLHGALTSSAFGAFLAAATGEALFVDPTFHGGGFHQGGEGSFLDMHVDFNIHPLHPDWLRRRNILIYLNPMWEESWGGQLLVRSGVDGPTRSIAPIFNRAVIMVTDSRTYHGYRRTTFPVGVTRRSIAAYAYREVPAGSVAARTTGWTPEGAGLAKRMLARNYNWGVRLKGRFGGSGTAANR